MSRVSPFFRPWVSKRSSDGLALLLLVCGGGCNSDMTPVSLVARVRVLAVVSEPPEVQPGQSADWRALLAAPPGDVEDIHFSFTQCTPVEGGCLEYLEALELTSGDEAAAESLYLATATRSGSGKVENLMLEVTGSDISTPHSALGRGIPMVQSLVDLVVCESEGCETETAGDGVYTATKRLVISNATSPNRNPHLQSVTLDETDVLEPGANPLLVAGEEYTLTARLTPDSVEHYTYVSPEGIPEERVEVPYVRWFSTAGSFSTPRSDFVRDEKGDMSARTTFVSQDVSGTSVGLYAVVWDGRGGMDCAAWVGDTP